MPTSYRPPSGPAKTAILYLCGRGLIHQYWGWLLGAAVLAAVAIEYLLPAFGPHFRVSSKGIEDI